MDETEEEPKTDEELPNYEEPIPPPPPYPIIPDESLSESNVAPSGTPSWESRSIGNLGEALQNDTIDTDVQPQASCISIISSSSIRIAGFFPRGVTFKEDCDSSCETSYDEALHNRFRRAINADTKVVIGSKEFPCHLVLLQAYSKYLQRVKRPSESVYRLELPQDIISENHFPTLMNWILLEEPSKHRIINKDTLVPLYAAGNALEIPGLVKQCWEFISEAMEKDDPIILHVYEQAKCPKFKELRNVLSTKLAEMFDTLYESRQFLSIGLDDFTVILDSDDVKIQSELDIFHAASRWLLYDWEDRSKDAARVMKCVRFGLLTSLQLTQIRHCAEVTNMEDYAQIFSFSEVKDMLNDGLTYAIFRENYESNPEELKKWLEWSNVNHPRKRNCLKEAATKPPNPSLVSGMQVDVSQQDINASIIRTTSIRNCKSSVCSMPPAPVLTSRAGIPAMKLFVDEVDDPTPLLSNRKSQQANTRQSSLQDPFTLASVLRSRMGNNNTSSYSK